MIEVGMVRKVAVLVVLVVAAVSCGKQHDAAVVETNIDAHALADAADHTTQAGTGRVHLTMSSGGASPGMSSSGGSGLFNTIGDGSYDTAAGLLSMTMSIDSSSMNLFSGVPGSPNTMGARADGTPVPLSEIIQHGQTLYFRMSLMAAFDPAVADKWIVVDLGKLRASGSSDASMTPLQGWDPMGDPSTILEYLKGAGADVTTVGHESIDGVDTTQVHGTLSMKQAIDAAGADGSKVRDSLKGVPGATGSLEDAMIPVDVYVDADHYVRRIALTYGYGNSAGLVDGDPDTSAGSDSRASGSGMTMTLTADYSAVGQPVAITEPAAADTINACDLKDLSSDGTRTGSWVPPGLC
jgi:hypothetical protein